MKTKPNFVGIGGQKCATTWMSECLRSHPEIYVSSPKELRYFVDNEDKGLSWYLGFFEGTDSYKCRGEFASNYIYFPESAQKIKDTLGDVKIIAVVRDPVERALSHIKHLIRDGDLPPMFGEIIKEDLIGILKQHPKVLSNSHYQPGLKSYYDVFGDSSVFVVSQSACMKYGRNVLNSLWGFLEVSHAFESSEAEKVVSKGLNPKFHWAEGLRKKIFVFAKYRAPWLINWVKRTGLSSAYRKLNQGQDLTFSPAASSYLSDLCADDWYKTQKLLMVR